jgi:uncharacterized protein (DUF4415 family)
MKRRKEDTKRAKAPRKVTKIEASAGSYPEVKRRPRYLPEEWAGMYKPVKRPVTLRLDADVLAWFQRAGRGYQTRINRILRKVMSEERKSAARQLG